MPIPDAPGLPPDLRVALVLGGGNALGAYHAGLYEALQAAEIEPDWIVGTSIGAVTGAIIAGNAPERRIDRLRSLWRPAGEEGHWPIPSDMMPEGWRRTGAVLGTLLGGRPGMFGPLGPLGSWWMQDPSSGSPALFASNPMADTLGDLVDFDRLNRATPRLTAVAVDVETGGEVEFDSAAGPLGPNHIRASAAFLTAYPAIEVEGRLLADGGLSMNLPLDPVLADPGEAPILCIAADLFPLSAGRPNTLGETAGRMQDINFAAQSRRSIARWQAEYAARAPDRRPSVTLARIAYSDQQQEVAGKVLDFSPQSVRQRWAAGRKDGAALAGRLRDGAVRLGELGLSVDADER